MTEVDFVVNCYERTYRDVLAPGFMAARVAEQQREFAEVTVLVNNVTDRLTAERLAVAAIESGEITRAVFVADQLAHALQVTGLADRAIRRLPHFTDCCLVAVTLDAPEWVVYWDADARLREPVDWVSPTLRYLDEHPDMAVGNPNNWHPGLAEREALSIVGDFAIGYGFSDVAFLARRSDLARPIYRKIAPAAWRYPLAHVEPIFEQRVDAWMRRDRRTRATYLPAMIDHVGPVGSNYPPRDLRARVRGRAQQLAARAAERLSEHPAMRAWTD